MKIKAFTLAEAIVMIGILGVIMAVTIPTIVKKDFKTDTSVRAASKAYGALAQAVSSIMQDGYYYKRFDNFGLADDSDGIDVLTGKHYAGNCAGKDPCVKHDSASEKFKNILLDTFYATNINDYASSVIFDTPDGVRWKMVWKTNTFSAAQSTAASAWNNNLKYPMLVFIDTNVKNGTDFGCRNLNQCKVIDTAVFLVHRNGNVVIDGVDTNAAVGVDKNGTLQQSYNSSAFNDEEFIKKLMGQHEKTQIETRHYDQYK